MIIFQWNYKNYTLESQNTNLKEYMLPYVVVLFTMAKI